MTAPSWPAASATAPGIWDCDLASGQVRGAYVALSGNTAAGKSSLLAAVERTLRAGGVDAVGVSERAFHHRYLRLMFSEPADFAFPIQLSFMLERYMVLLRNLVQLGRTVIMERSHLDDHLFVEEHVRSGAISDEQRAAYAALAGTLHVRLPVPDVIVLMNPDPELSLARLAAAERAGHRPAEFPSEEAKAAWVHRWHDLYVELHRSFARRQASDPAFAGTTLLELDPAGDQRDSAAAVIAAVRPYLPR